MAPSQLNFFASGRPQSSDYHDIVPRTPHSRSGHAEEAVTQADLDDEDAAAASSACWKAMGMIELHTFRTRELQRMVPVKYRAVDITQHAVHERSKKAGRHQVL